MNNPTLFSRHRLWNHLAEGTRVWPVSFTSLFDRGIKQSDEHSNDCKNDEDFSARDPPSSGVRHESQALNPYESESPVLCCSGANGAKDIVHDQAATLNSKWKVCRLQSRKLTGQFECDHLAPCCKPPRRVLETNCWEILLNEVFHPAISLNAQFDGASLAACVLDRKRELVRTIYILNVK